MKIHIPLRFLLLLLMSVWSVLVLAAPAPDLYVARLEVSGRQPQVLQAALRDGLVQVLVKLTGLPAKTIRDEPLLAFDLKNGHSYASQYTYETEKQLLADGSEKERLFIKAKYAEAQVDTLRQKAGLNLWPANRPRVLVWPLLKLDGESLLADQQDMVGVTDAKLWAKGEQQNRFVSQIASSAWQSGLPYLLSQRQQLSQFNFNQAWAWDAAALQRFSILYEKDADFVARAAISSEGKVMGGWLLLEKEGSKSIDVTADSVEAFVQQGMDWLVEYWANKYAIKISLHSNEVLVSVANIDDYQKYEQVMDYFASLDVVENTYLLNVHEQSLQLAVALKANAEQFRQQVLLSPLLEADVAAAADDFSTMNSGFNFRWKQ